MRESITFQVEDSEVFKRQLVCFSRQLQYSAIFNSCNYYKNIPSAVHYHSNNFLAGLDHVNIIEGSFNQVETEMSKLQDWLLGSWTYDLKNEFENLYSVNYDGLNFPLAIFFQPRYVISLKEMGGTLEYLPQHNSKEDAIELIQKIKAFKEESEGEDKVRFKARVSKEKYCQSIASVLDHIHKGDIYELNYCMEFFAEQIHIDPYSVYNKLVSISPTPFSSFIKLKDKYVMSASPERYLKKEGDKLISQPIKGTTKRGASVGEDKQLKKYLQSCVKEQSENIMITDLVRNDLSRVACKGTVEVEELCGIYPFKQVFQMISTISAQLHEDKTGLDAIKASFPAGSMTGAPKIRAMKLIEKYEETKRGLYSGAVGYFSPNGDFDFNVVIRSLLYNASNQYLSFMVGSAITEKSIAEDEYDECLLKAKAILQLFNQEKLT
ncbi:anthranilate synthase component I family protein [Labilibacter marinus]|uniref:anthranilate synthase component I family protein n=1 Tax=Labilibacter marinus TaxID=1477105 RepID=UPI000831A8E3|nr:anthranilate synthase component I family protein [Labilibacter marinus]